jgi:hypothetical protein
MKYEGRYPDMDSHPSWLITRLTSQGSSRECLTLRLSRLSFGHVAVHVDDI